MAESKPSDIKCSRAFWTHGVVGPYTLKAEHRLGVLVGLDRRLTPAAGVVFRFLVSWDMEAHGNALASVDFISDALKAQDPAGIGLSSSAVGSALKLLRRTGWITQTYRGTGPKNASRYQVNWEALALAEKGDFPSIVANRPDIVDGAEPSTHSGQYRPDLVDAFAENRPDIVDKDSLTSDAPKGARTESETDHRPPTAPDRAGPPGAAPPVSAVEGFTHTQAEPTFKSFLAAYEPADMSRPARTKAKKEWDALDDDTDLAAVIEAAKAWQASWARQDRPDAPRKSAAAWLHDEFYLKPAPKGFQKLEKARKAKADTKDKCWVGLKIKRFTIIDHQTEGSESAGRRSHSARRTEHSSRSVCTFSNQARKT